MKNKKIMQFISFLLIGLNINKAYAAAKNTGLMATLRNGAKNLVKPSSIHSPKKDSFTQGVVKDVLKTVQEECNNSDLSTLKDSAGEMLGTAVQELQTTTFNHIGALGRKTIFHLGKQVNQSRRAALTQLRTETERTVDHIGTKTDELIDHTFDRTEALLETTAYHIPNITKEVCAISGNQAKKLADQVRTDVKLDVISILICGYSAIKGIESLSKNDCTGALFLLPAAAFFFKNIRNKNELKNNELMSKKLHASSNMFTNTIKQAKPHGYTSFRGMLISLQNDVPSYSFLDKMYRNCRPKQPPTVINHSRTIMMHI